jgi:hypothetical protein
MKRLERKFDDLQTSGTDSMRRSRSYSPRVHFSDQPQTRGPPSTVRESSPSFQAQPSRHFGSYTNERSQYRNQTPQYEGQFNRASSRPHYNRDGPRDGPRGDGPRGGPLNRDDPRPSYFNQRDNNHRRGRHTCRGPSHGYSSPGQTSNPNQEGLCSYCGRCSNHVRYSCPARGASCWACSGIGHFASVCRKSQTSY